ncbi:MAG: hypothetical protein CMH57_04800 [Myxococcales bacterium]|nr:hypothetical protein [Myxococcales bacterium]
MIDLFGKRLIINTGKGGVGKTTLSAAIGLAAARRGKRVLLMELNAKEKTSRLFGSSPIGFEPTEVEDNLFAVNITPKEALREYAILKLRLKTLYRAVFENRFVRTFLRVIPGLNELVLLGKVWFEEQANDGPGGRPRWDMIVVDAPATGHGVFFLQIPAVITNIVSSGPMFDEARQIQAMIEDSSRTVLNLITLVEEMPINETIELKRTTEETLQVPLGYVIANAVYEPMFSDRQRDLVTAVRAETDSDGSHLDRLLEAATFRSNRVQLQREYIERLDRELDLPQIHIPYYFTERFNFMTLSKIADEIERQLTGRVDEDPPDPPQPAASGGG